MAKKEREKNITIKSKTATADTRTVDSRELIFGKRNYFLLISGVIVMAIGYMLMTGGAQPPDEFDTKEIYGFVRITLSSILVTAGLVIVLFSIFARHK